jgi:hypothetical protein
MSRGPGKYDSLCTLAREQANADAAILIILNGNKGSGFSVQVHGALRLQLPELLETVAADIRKGETPDAQ